MKPVSFELRAAGHADRDAIARVWHASASLPTVGPAAMPSLAELRRRLDIEFDGGWRVTVAVHAGTVVGFVATRPAEAVLDQLFVAPAALGGGIGQRLLDHVMAEMPGGFTLFTRSANVRARRFYERRGLVFVRDDLHPVNRDPICHYRWEGASP